MQAQDGNVGLLEWLGIRGADAVHMHTPKVEFHGASYSCGSIDEFLRGPVHPAFGRCQAEGVHNDDRRNLPALLFRHRLQVGSRAQQPLFLRGETYKFKGVAPRSTTLKFEESWEQRSEEHTSELQSLRHLVCRL